MTELNMRNADYSDLANAMGSGTTNYYEVEADTLDVAGDQKETTYQNSNWGQYLGS